MNNKDIQSQLSPILSPKEIQTLIKRLKNKPITQTESNYLSRSIRPKLQAAEQAASLNLLPKINYKRKKYQRSDIYLKKQILNAAPKNMRPDIEAIILYGSYLENNRTDYNDIDILIVLNKKTWKNLKEKSLLKEKIEKNTNIPVDITLLTSKELKESLPYNPILQNQLQTHKLLHGKIKLSKITKINKPYLYKLSGEIEAIKELSDSMSPRQLYYGIRTALAILFFLQKTLNNKKIIQEIKQNIGEKTFNGLKQDTLTKLQKQIVLLYLNHLYAQLERRIYE